MALDGLSARLITQNRRRCYAVMSLAWRNGRRDRRDHDRGPALGAGCRSATLCRLGGLIGQTMMNRVTEPNASSFASLEKTFVDRWQAALLIAGLVAISLNQRPALVAVGPLTAQLRAETGIGAAERAC